MTFGITDPANLPLGMIRYPPPRQSPSKKFLDQFGLFDASNQLVAYSDPFSYAINWNLSLSASDSFNGLKKNGLYVRAPDGNVLAIIHGSNNSDGCQVDLYNSDVNQTLVMSLIAFILTLPYPH